jgi:PKD repeat protein
VADEPYNHAPICDLQVVTPMPHSGDGVVEFDASGSWDPDGDPITYAWDFDGDGNYDEVPDDSYTGPPENPIHTYTDNFMGLVWLRVEDNKWHQAECTAFVMVTI